MLDPALDLIQAGDPVVMLLVVMSVLATTGILIKVWQWSPRGQFRFVGVLASNGGLGGFSRRRAARCLSRDCTTSRTSVRFCTM